MSPSHFAALVLALGALGASSAHALSCQNRIIDVGDPAARVRALCGEPSSISTHVEERSVTVRRRAPGGAIVGETVTVAVTIERWIYDFGPQRFVRELEFEAGRLRAIRTLGYGTPAGRSARAPAQPLEGAAAKPGNVATSSASMACTISSSMSSRPAARRSTLRW